jgi:hypothetical protein
MGIARRVRQASGKKMQWTRGWCLVHESHDNPRSSRESLYYGDVDLVGGWMVSVPQTAMADTEVQPIASHIAFQNHG